MKKNFIPVYEPVVATNQFKYVQECIRANWISSQGKYVKEFEKGFARFCNVRYGVAVTNGTAALHLALVSLGIKAGDEVIMPTFTMAATAFAVFYTGAKPVLVDADEETFNINPAKIENKITKKTKAIIAVHMYGHPCEMDSIIKIAKKYRLFLVEDAAEAHGAEYKGKKVGSFGDAGCFSFYANKIITTGEGGMIVTNNSILAKKARQLRNMAFGEGRNKFVHTDIGFNYRMTNIQAAIGLAQLEKIKKIIEMKRKNAEIYNNHLKNIPGLKIPVEKEWAKNVYWMYSISVDKIPRDDLINKLAQKGIETRPFFTPMHLQPIFQKIGLFKNENYPICEKLSRRGLYLPSGSNLSKKKIIYICEILKKYVK